MSIVPGQRPFRLQTSRLTIRTLSRHDVTAFTHYRTLPDVARYQDWPMPYTRDLAIELVDEMELGPMPGGWVQLAIDIDDQLIGDVAVWLDQADTLAMIGYTLDPLYQGHGYAVEAVGAVIEWLFHSKHVHRIAATIDPRNMASARVLERCGFEHVGTARSAAFVRGEWTDDARFSLLEPDWRAWCTRPTDPPAIVDLVEITAENVEAVGDIDRAFSQRAFVASVAVSLADALVPRTVGDNAIRPWYRAIVADEEISGFVMMAEPYDGNPHPYLWRLVIDRRHQGRGIGRRTLVTIAAERRAAGATHLAVSYVPEGVGSPARFYERLGFVRTGEVGGVDEVKALANLSVALLA